MSKRFTDTGKWDDPWFRKMTPAAKLFWQWICDKCDHAGVVEMDYEYASFQLGIPVSEATLQEYGERVVHLRRDKYWIRKFVQFQYGKLSPGCKPHGPVFAALEKHGLKHYEVEQNASFRELVDASLRRKILERDGFTCVYFGTSLTEEEAVIDHVVPRILGGRAVPSNLVVASAAANNQKAEMPVELFCKKAGLDFLTVSQRLSKAFAKPIKGYHGSLKEEDKEKEMDKEKEGGAGGDFAAAIPKAQLIEAVVKAYPVNGNAIEARRWLTSTNPTPADLQEILSKVQILSSKISALPQDLRRYCPAKHTFFEGRRWEDDPEGTPWTVKSAAAAKPATAVHDKWNKKP